MRPHVNILIVLFSVSLFGQTTKTNQSKTNKSTKMSTTESYEIATLAGGCFWCTEAVFLSIDGVKKVVSGYTGGTIKNPAYREITTGRTGHAEAIQITFDPKKVDFATLLEIFFATHDPTTLNRQGNDVGTQYRSEIFYHSEAQKTIAEKYIALLGKEKVFDDPIVTKISALTVFYEAEDYHQNYYNQNKNQPYCNFVITPKMEKLKKKFAKNLKK